MIGRSKRACGQHWNDIILPILKTDALGLPQDINWMKDFLRYVVTKKIRSIEQLSYNQIVKHICPGQTNKSLNQFANNTMRIWYERKSFSSNEPLYEICKTKLNDASVYSFLGNKHKVDKKLNYVKEILEIKRILML